jgi:bifunctional non-homologous end joining protein LigD
MATARVTDLLEPYRLKRDFTRTSEPSGAVPHADAEGRRRFVVQRHRARRLHYDFRLEVDGVLVSWAVPKGPTLDPDVRRLAVHVEDHPMEYEWFEGVIPAGEYGGGDVIVWDRGSWQPHGTDDPAEAVRRGELHLDLLGERLVGRFALVRRGSDPSRSGGEQWLLVHKHDAYAVTGWDPETLRTSVLSGRTSDEVRAAPDAEWRSDEPAATALHRLGTPTRSLRDEELAELAGLGSEGRWTVFDRTLRVTNLDKVLFPGRDGQPPVTKRELLAYTARIAPVLLPYLTGRALNLHRYPDGSAAKGFWHKEVPAKALTDPTTPCSTSTRARTPRGRRCSSWPGCTAPPSSTSACGRTRRSPGGGACRSGCRSGGDLPSTRPASGWSASRAPSGRCCPTSSAGSGRSVAEAVVPGWTTPRTP